MLIVRITVDGGVIQHVSIPDGVSVIIRGYGVDDLPPKVLRRDEQGDDYLETIWNHEK